MGYFQICKTKGLRQEGKQQAEIKCYFDPSFILPLVRGGLVVILLLTPTHPLLSKEGKKRGGFDRISAWKKR
jgi:hypothetical protein